VTFEFSPFGQRTCINDIFYISDNEAFSKKTTKLTINLAPPPALPEADLGIDKDADKSSASPGEFIVFTLDVSTQGFPATNVEVNDPLPDVLSFEDVSPSDLCEHDDLTNTVNCFIDTISVGETVPIEISTRVNDDAEPGSSHDNTAGVDSDDVDDPDFANNFGGTTFNINDDAGGGDPTCDCENFEVNVKSFDFPTIRKVGANLLNIQFDTKWDTETQ